MKEKLQEFITSAEEFVNRLMPKLITLLSPLIEQYKIAASSKYGKLIRMDSYWVYPLLFLPSWMGIIMGSRGFTLEHITLLLLFGIGSFLMRSVGCIMNDLADIKLDGQVDRTKNRSIVSGEVSVSEAKKVILNMLLMGAVVLITLPKPAIIAGIVAAIMTGIYPYTKRFMKVPQLFLGFTFNIGVIMGWLSVTNSNPIAMTTLYFGFALLTVAYDTIYACQDLEDDLKIGINSFPTLLINKNINIKSTVWTIYRLSAACIGITGLMIGANLIFFSCLAYGVYFLYNKLELCDINNPESCREHFKKVSIFLFILFLGTLLGK